MSQEEAANVAAQGPDARNAGANPDPTAAPQDRLPLAIILLAAGDSSRLGHPKQLVTLGDRPLLRQAAEVALAAELGPVLVVLGAVEERCRETLAGLPLTILVNTKWQEGMGTSIAAGMQSVTEDSHRGVIIMPCDQPAITPDHLRALDDQQRATRQSIVASSYAGTVGTPALFASVHFSRLRSLRGAKGAKSLFETQFELATVPCPGAALDIDTEADVLRFRATFAP